MNKNIDVYFFLMEHNFIDKITPVIDLLIKTGYKVKLIKCMHNYNYDADLNLKYLLAKYPNLYIEDLFLGENKLYSSLHKLYNIFNFKQSLQKGVLLKSVYYLLTTIVRRTIVYTTDITDKDVENIFTHSSKKIVIMDLTESDFLYKKLRRKINQLEIPNYAFHHAFNIISNYLTTYGNLVKKDKVPIDEVNKFADKIIMYNSFAIEHINDLFRCEKIQLPSLRYSSEWMNVIEENRPKFSIVDQNKYKLKIVFMLTHVDYNVWKEELFRTIQVVLMIPEVYLVVKVHPRSIKEKNKFLKLKNENFQVVANEISSSSLIDWSDIVMNISSGIMMEAIIKRKNIFYMKYLHCNSITPETTSHIIHTIDTRDQLISLLKSYLANKDQEYIQEEQVVEFLKDYIGDDNYKENCERYLQFIESEIQCL